MTLGGNVTGGGVVTSGGDVSSGEGVRAKTNLPMATSGPLTRLAKASALTCALRTRRFFFVLLLKLADGQRSRRSEDWARLESVVAMSLGDARLSSMLVMTSLSVFRTASNETQRPFLLNVTSVELWLMVVVTLRTQHLELLRLK